MKHLRFLILPIVVSLFAAGCEKTTVPLPPDEEEPDKESPVPIEKIVLSKTSVSMARGDSFEFHVTVFPKNADIGQIRWASSDESVATVSSEGIVRALSVGEAVVSASSGEVSAECDVVVGEVPVESLELNHSALELKKGDSETLVVSFVPEDADNKQMTWSSSDEFIASVSQEGVVTGVSVGKAVIEATAENGVSAECTVTVSGVPGVGDWFYSDGTYSAEVNPNKTVIGIVFWTGDPTADDPVLKEDFPECTNGLAVSLDEVGTSWLDVMAAREYKDLIGDWIEENTDYPSVTTNTEDGKMEKILGYGMTRGLIEFNNAPENKDRQIQFINELDIFRTDCPDVSGTSGWFMPSARELELLCSGESNGRPDWVPGMNKRIIESKLRDMGYGGFSFLYWSCLELDGEEALLYGFSEPGYYCNGKSFNREARFVFAF